LLFERRHAAALLSFNSRNTYQFKEQRMSTSFTAMTWNVENLFPPGVQVSAQKTVTLEDYDAKLAYLTEKILEIQPDVLALQEIGGKDVADTRPMDDLRPVEQPISLQAALQPPRRAASVWVPLKTRFSKP
jgi:predicted extracellular nuclease